MQEKQHLGLLLAFDKANTRFRIDKFISMACCRGAVVPQFRSCLPTKDARKGFDSSSTACRDSSSYPTEPHSLLEEMI